MLVSSNTAKRLSLIQNSINLIKTSKAMESQTGQIVSNLVKTRAATERRLEISKGLIFRHSQTLDKLVLAPDEEVDIEPGEALVAL